MANHLHTTQLLSFSVPLRVLRDSLALADERDFTHDLLISRFRLSPFRDSFVLPADMTAGRAVPAHLDRYEPIWRLMISTQPYSGPVKPDWP